MSRVKQLADEEASRAEAELEDAHGTDPPTSPEPTADPLETPRGDQAERSMEHALRAFERENTRHELALRKIMGEDFDGFEPCPTCSAVGFRPEVAIRFDSQLERCDTCAGHGFLLTYSVREDRVVRECVDCQGNGYRNKPFQLPPQPVAQPVQYQGLPNGWQPPQQAQPAYVQQPDGSWAPGYVPPGSPLPGPPPGT